MRTLHGFLKAIFGHILKEDFDAPRGAEKIFRSICAATLSRIGTSKNRHREDVLVAFHAIDSRSVDRLFEYVRENVLVKSVAPAFLSASNSATLFLDCVGTSETLALIYFA